MRLGDVPGRAGRPGPAADQRRAPWVGAVLVAWLVMLAPWGGPCDRWGRRADPTTMQSTSGDARPSSRAADPSDPQDEMYLDILDDEEDGEGCEAECLAASPSPMTPPPPASMGALHSDPHHDHSGRSARSPFLRC